MVVDQSITIMIKKGSYLNYNLRKDMSEHLFSCTAKNCLLPNPR